MSTLSAQRLPVGRTLIALACAMSASGAWSQAASNAPTGVSADPENAPITQVTVTARKRKEVMLDVPISLQTMGEKELRATGISDVKDLGEQTGFSFSSAQGSGAQGRSFGVVTFRGLQGELNFPWENSGGVFVDGIFISGGVSGLGLGDVARVEVLKGPQNAFFGRSTFGGAVNFITKQPSSSFGGTVNLSVNHLGTTDADASIEGPLLGDMVSGRLSFGSKNKAAQFRATDGGELGAEHTTYVSGTVYIKPNEDLWLRLRGHYQKDEDSLPATGMITAAGNTSCTGRSYTGKNAAGQTVSYTPTVSYFCGGLPSYKDVGPGIFDANTALPGSVYQAFVNNSLNDPFLAKSPKLTHTGMLRETTRLSAQMGLRLPQDMDLAVNAGYNESASTSIHDLDRTKTAAFIALQTNPTRDLTLDARLSTDATKPLRGLVGVSYFQSTFQLSQIDLSMAFGGTTPSRSTGAYLDLKSEVPAVYASVEYDLTPQWTITGEARYQKDKTTFTSFAGAVTSNEVSNTLPRVTLRYKPNATTSAYLNVASGVQPLTVNGGYANANATGKAYLESLFPGITAFTPQPKLDSVELGLKQQVNRSLQYALAVYDQKWSNRLSGTTVFNPGSCGATTNTPACPFATSGVGVTVGNEARIRGLELNLDAQLSNAWSVGSYIDYKKATWRRFNAGNAQMLTAPAVAFDGNEVGRLPNWTVTANTTYRWSFAGWSAYSRADATFVGSRWDSDFNFTRVAGYNRLDLRQGFERKDLLLELFVRNAMNNQGWQSTQRYPNLTIVPLTNFNQQGTQVTMQEGRTVGARVRYSF